MGNNGDDRDEPFYRLKSWYMWVYGYIGYDIQPLNFKKRVEVILWLEKWAACRGTLEDLASIQQRKEKLHERIKLEYAKLSLDLEDWWIRPGEELALV